MPKKIKGRVKLMAAIHGKNAFLSVNAQPFSGYLKSTGLDTPTDMIDVTTFGNHSKIYIPGLEDGTIPLEGVWDATVDGYVAAIKTAGSVAFIYGPAGDTVGFVKYSGNAIISSYNINQDPTGEVKFSATLQINGDVTRGVF
jgi:predicted secreted protein